ncbi:dephospho-CoA kinase [Streptococcus sp. S784/96/1]|uniref:dephospho-CoA kinase n=1 Tax=Streptococcus sp. S784/96/1 TaxID=2653499 RepID=UPI001389CA9D|nr:dephospho-CoA kinase [Streptococcus sp. S784/96/1]
MKKVIGLTGGIASGKSTVSAYLREKGYAVVDADQVVRDLQQKGGTLYQVLLEWLGEGILQADGELNRSEIGKQIFASKEMLAASAERQNPIIRQALWEQKEALLATEEVVILDIPLLFEQGYESWCDEVWLVWVDEQTQLTRLVARNGYTEEEAKQRIVAQMPLADKKEKASHWIDNNGELAETFAQVDALLR